MDKILRIVLTLYLFGISTLLFGQTDNTMQDVLFLKNGKKIKGYILATDSINVKILSYKDKLTIVGDTDIIHQEKQAPGKITLFNEHRFKSSGYQSQIELMSAKATYYRSFTSIRFINGYKFNSRYFAGLGLGATSHHSYYGNLFYANYFSYPIFLRISADLWVKKSSPYIYSDFGSQLQVAKDKELKPLFIRLGIGNKFITKRTILYTSLGYSYNKARYYYNYQNTEGYSYWYRNHTAELSFGMQFN
jgi:hypothetical protein